MIDLESPTLVSDHIADNKMSKILKLINGKDYS
jgi:hypothetical protein